MTKQTKTKIGVGSVVKAKVGELEKIIREGIIRRTRKAWLSTPGAIFRLFVFFCWNDLSHKNTN